ncbi:MAG: TetR/AcrR family transcriptional regulator [Defluviitaleaceae bacterium]|nr:TetR/AcrR family transcriptional regulator [Defluviitaleaceae bacterium]
MDDKTYHHGDLRAAMIEKGIELINENGAKALSLRKVAAACGVSHAAPYSHFAGKEELFTAIENYITNKFASVLKESVTGKDASPEGLVSLGCAYVLFFLRNPQYFHFIFIHSNIVFGDGAEYEPFDFYVDYMKQMLGKMDYPKELWLKTAIAHWAMIHGLTSIAAMDDDPKEILLWEERVPDILSNNYLLLPMNNADSK